jgi:hypothetical protein
MRAKVKHRSNNQAFSLDHLVGAGDERRWDLEAEGLGGFEIDCEV